MALRKAQRLVLPSSQPGGWECIQKRQSLSSSYWRRSLPEWVPSLEAGNQSIQGLYLFLVPFGIGVFAMPNAQYITIPLVQSSLPSISDIN
jgi:hypothetical protein